MNFSKDKPNLATQKIEIEENKILEFFKKFWRFSNFYGEYLASLCSK